MCEEKRVKKSKKDVETPSLKVFSFRFLVVEAVSIVWWMVNKLEIEYFKAIHSSQQTFRGHMQHP